MWACERSAIFLCVHACKHASVPVYMYMRAHLLVVSSSVDFNSWEHDLHLYNHQMISNCAEMPDIFKSGHWAKDKQHLLFGQIETHNADLYFFSQIIGAHGSVWVSRSFTELTVNCSCKAKDTIWLWLHCPVLLTCKALAKIMACQVQFSYQPLTP